MILHHKPADRPLNAAERRAIRARARRAIKAKSAKIAAAVKAGRCMTCGDPAEPARLRFGECSHCWREYA